MGGLEFNRAAFDLLKVTVLFDLYHNRLQSDAARYRQLLDLRNLERNTIDIGYWYTKLDLSSGLIDLPEKNRQSLFATNATRRATGDLQRFHMVTTQ